MASAFRITEGVDFLLDTLVLGGLRFLPVTTLLPPSLFVDSTGKAEVDAFFVFFLTFVGCLEAKAEGDAPSNDGLDLELE